MKEHALILLLLVSMAHANPVVPLNPGPSINLGETITGVVGGVVGGFGDWSPATDEIQSISDQFRSEVEAQMNRLLPFTKYISMTYRTQVVAGTNYIIRIDVGEEVYLEITVFESLPLPQPSLTLTGVQWAETDEAPSINLGETITGVVGVVVGGFGEWSPATDEIQSICDQIRSEVEVQMNRLSPFVQFEAVRYSSQVVAGTNYNIMIDVGEEVNLEITVFESLPLPQSSLTLTRVQWADEGLTTESNLVGGFGEWSPATDEIQSICDQLRFEVEAQMNRLTPFTKYIAVTYRGQAVQGINYEIRIDVGEEKYLEIKVYESLPFPQSSFTLTGTRWAETGGDQDVNVEENQGGDYIWSCFLQAFFNNFKRDVVSPLIPQIHALQTTDVQT